MRQDVLLEILDRRPALSPWIPSSATFAVSVSLVAVLVTVKCDLKSLVLESYISSGYAYSETTVVSEVSHTRDHILSRVESLILQLSLYILLQVLLVIVLRLMMTPSSSTGVMLAAVVMPISIGVCLLAHQGLLFGLSERLFVHYLIQRCSNRQQLLPIFFCILNLTVTLYDAIFFLLYQWL